MDDPGRHRSPRRGLQGPRPAPLEVGKHSRRAKKPPLPPQRRPPVIIYTDSPKVFHADPSEFMSLVQNLTGARSGASEASTAAPQAASGSTGRLELDTGATSFDRTGVPSPVPEVLPAISPTLSSPPAVNTSNEFSATLFGGFSSGYDNYVDNYLFNQDFFNQDQDL